MGAVNLWGGQYYSLNFLWLDRMNGSLLEKTAVSFLSPTIRRIVMFLFVFDNLVSIMMNRLNHVV